jgi:hypothetical protein
MLSAIDRIHCPPSNGMPVRHHRNPHLMLAHAQCNKEKHNKTLAEHWEWRVNCGLDRENLGRKHKLLPED